MPATAIVQFPSLVDRKHVHSLINSYAKGKITRNDLMRQIAQIINKYPSIERMPVFGYSVRILQYYNDLPIISIEGAEITDTCPGCGSDSSHAKYLRTEQENNDMQYDIISSTCIECGAVYMSQALNGRMTMEY